MNFTRKEYTTRNEKILDFVIGFVGWYLVNGLFYACTVTLLSQANNGIDQNVYALILLALPLLINVGALIGLGMWRRWIALGALAGFGAALALVLLLGILIYAVCFNMNFS